MRSNDEIRNESVKYYDAFISYSSHDSEVATQLAIELERAGFNYWLDKREVLVGHNIVERVNLGISNSRFMIVLLSPSSIQSEWVKSEYSSAHIAEIESNDVVILPVLVEPCDIPQLLRNKRYAVLTDWGTGVEEILNAMKGHGTTVTERVQSPEKLRKAIVSESVSFPLYRFDGSLSELFCGGILFSPIPKKIRNMSFEFKAGERINVAINLDDEDVAILGC